MASNPYAWRDYIPLSSSDARRAFRKGVQVFCLHSSRLGEPVTSEAEIRKHAKKGRIFVVKRMELKKAETTYIAEYEIRHPLNDPEAEMKAVLVKEYDDHFALFEEGNNNFSILATQCGCPDGEYWVEYSGFEKVFGKKSCTTFDEGVMTFKDGKVVNAPKNFWLPF